MSPTKVELALFAMIRIVFYIPRLYCIKNDRAYFFLYGKYNFHNSVINI